MSRLNHFLFLTVVTAALAAIWGASQPTTAAPTENPIVVTTTIDTMGGDAQCSLREALHNANNNTQFVDAPGECPAGSANELDIIVLASGEEYVLVLPGGGNDAGDLDVLDNVRFTVDGETAATIRMDVAGQRVMEIHGVTAELHNITLRGGITSDNGGGILNNGEPSP
jgi:CSLREA domain-containing protein